MTAHATVPDMVVSDDGKIIRITVRGRTYVCKEDVASIVRSHKDQHPDAGPAFLHGFLLAIEMAHEMARDNSTKGASNGQG